MGEKKEKGIEKMRERIEQRIRKQEIRREANKKAALKAKTNKDKAEQVYQDWLKKHEVKALKAVQIIWNWYEEFISSPIFKEMANVMGEKGEVQISKIISCVVPERGSLEYKREEKQMLAVDKSGNLFVHNCVKYGKSYEVCHREDMHEYVEIPVLIEIAGTITDETIWDIVDFR